MPGLYSAGFPVLEGDYSTWTKLWEADFPDGLKDDVGVTITLGPDYVYILYEDASAGTYNRFVILNLADGTSKFTSPSGAHYMALEPHMSYQRTFFYNSLAGLWWGGASVSVFGKYVLFLRSGNVTFEVWKDGVKVWTSPDVTVAVPGAADWANGLIRYDGKYILAVSNAGVNKLVCYEGS